MSGWGYCLVPVRWIQGMDKYRTSQVSPSSQSIDFSGGQSRKCVLCISDCQSFCWPISILSCRKFDMEWPSFLHHNIAFIYSPFLLRVLK
mgnify:CR=1 FL=1